MSTPAASDGPSSPPSSPPGKPPPLPPRVPQSNPGSPGGSTMISSSHSKADRVGSPGGGNEVVAPPNRRRSRIASMSPPAHADEDDGEFVMPTVALYDPGQLWQYAEGPLKIYLPLKKLSMRSSASDAVVTVEEVPVKILVYKTRAAMDEASERCSAPENWYRAPFASVYMVTSENAEHYKTVVRPKLQEWVESMRSSPPQRGGWLLLYVHVGPQSTQGPPTDEVHGRIFGIMCADLYSRAPGDRAAFVSVYIDGIGGAIAGGGRKSVGDDGSTPPPRVRNSGAPEPSSPQHFPRQWSDLLTKVGHTVSDSFESKVRLYEAELRRLEGKRGTPSWDSKAVFSVKEALALLHRGVGMHKDALFKYQDLARLCEEAAAPLVLEAEELDPLLFGPHVPSTGDASSSSSGARLPISVLDYSRMGYRALALDGGQLATQLYIFARQCQLYLDLRKPDEMAQCASRFISAFHHELVESITSQSKTGSVASAALAARVDLWALKACWDVVAEADRFVQDNCPPMFGDNTAVLGSGVEVNGGDGVRGVSPQRPVPMSPARREEQATMRKRAQAMSVAACSLLSFAIDRLLSYAEGLALTTPSLLTSPLWELDRTGRIADVAAWTPSSSVPAPPSRPGGLGWESDDETNSSRSGGLTPVGMLLASARSRRQTSFAREESQEGLAEEADQGRGSRGASSGGPTSGVEGRLDSAEALEGVYLQLTKSLTVHFVQGERPRFAALIQQRRAELLIARGEYRTALPLLLPLASLREGEEWPVSHFWARHRIALCHWRLHGHYTAHFAASALGMARAMGRGFGEHWNGAAGTAMTGVLQTVQAAGGYPMQWVGGSHSMSCVADVDLKMPRAARVGSTFVVEATLVSHLPCAVQLQSVVFEVGEVDALVAAANQALLKRLGGSKRRASGTAMSPRPSMPSPPERQALALDLLSDKADKSSGEELSSPPTTTTSSVDPPPVLPSRRLSSPPDAHSRMLSRPASAASNTSQTSTLNVGNVNGALTQLHTPGRDRAGTVEGTAASPSQQIPHTASTRPISVMLQPGVNKLRFELSWDRPAQLCAASLTATIGRERLVERFVLPGPMISGPPSFKVSPFQPSAQISLLVPPFLAPGFTAPAVIVFKSCRDSLTGAELRILAAKGGLSIGGDCGHCPEGSALIKYCSASADDATSSSERLSGSEHEPITAAWKEGLLAGEVVLSLPDLPTGGHLEVLLPITATETATIGASPVSLRLTATHTQSHLSANSSKELEVEPISRTVGGEAVPVVGWETCTDSNVIVRSPFDASVRVVSRCSGAGDGTAVTLLAEAKLKCSSTVPLFVETCEVSSVDGLSLDIDPYTLSLVEEKVVRPGQALLVSWRMRVDSGASDKLQAATPASSLGNLKLRYRLVWEGAAVPRPLPWTYSLALPAMHSAPDFVVTCRTVLGKLEGGRELTVGDAIQCDFRVRPSSQLQESTRINYAIDSEGGWMICGFTAGTAELQPSGSDSSSDTTQCSADDGGPEAGDAPLISIVVIPVKAGKLRLPTLKMSIHAAGAKPSNIDVIMTAPFDVAVLPPRETTRFRRA